MGAHVVVYGRAGCEACRATERALQRAGVEFEVVDLDRNPAALRLVQALEFTTAPVVTTGREWWSGFRPDRIKAVTKA
ncbi:ribonucleoside-diphosphate reductase class Ib glutaredoxin subunit [Georgenia satyanarayanai]|uniref:Ribonucleoside-diphosphate reductase class Ib glutaredoxin subunit n=1 Tax=Georgenia satyanarayanai TaxID=860221 RepID=A0A2Y9AR46_9MICO|nr:glutaredoxin domain-containing protein [Georgenia satyanarayanai]PYF96381.1 ribonucleoside-diphosphate reductase class Ib glutaredoxin subunit [Georgenia satyanarayanai]SSA46931.1 ribonucleoside-diphosphate reductase class Ib glutaredoxin subunit [Georgenia satyanarayanai]